MIQLIEHVFSRRSINEYGATYFRADLISFIMIISLVRHLRRFIKFHNYILRIVRSFGSRFKQLHTSDNIKISNI